ncbi:MAG: PDZ domain-containing protein [Planctomycetota bacterium]|nr:MAG: PDZ domain-containing protein [Planctomycetota bacterium]
MINAMSQHPRHGGHGDEARLRTSQPLLLLAILCLTATAGFTPMAAVDGEAEAEQQAGDDGIVVLEWSIRQEIQELIEDLRSGRGGISDRLQAVAQLLARHGDRPFPYQGRYLPVSDVLVNEMRREQILSAFIRQFSTVAQRSLNDALASGDEQQLLQVTTRYPGTEAAAAAWRRLTDRAWDSGRLGLYLTWAQRSGEAEDPLRGQRIPAAKGLLMQRQTVELPPDLDHISRMWGASAPDLASADTRANDPAQRLPVVNSDSGVAFSQLSESGMVAITNGSHLALLDPLVGSLVGPPLRLGSPGLLRTPALSRQDLVVSVAQDDSGRPVLICSDTNGAVRWRQSLPLPLGASAVSSPAILDGVAAIAATVFEEDGAELRLLGYDINRGILAFNISIAKDTTVIRRLWRHHQQSQVGGPLLVTHRGGFAVANERGVVATLGPDGSLASIWASRGAMAQALVGRDFGRASTPRRPAQLLSDNRHLVLTDSHGSGVTVLSPEAGGPQLQARRYTGNGSADTLVAVADGLALLVGRRATLLDLETLEPRWSQELGGSEGTSNGHIGDNRVLVVRDTVVSLLSRDSGTVIGQRYFSRQASITVTAGILITARSGDFIGYGDGARFRQRLDQARRDNPQDFRPLIALYGLYRASDDHARAYDHLVAALNLQAPTRYAEEAAALLRPRLSIRIGRSDADDDLRRFHNLGRWSTRLTREAHWWQGRHHENAGNRSAAAKSFSLALRDNEGDDEGNMTALSPALRADIRALAEAGLARVQDGQRGQEPPAWAQPQQRPQIKAAKSAAWEVSGSRLGAPLISGDLVIEYAGGDIQARRLSDGEVAWRRQGKDDITPMLGVRFRPRDPGVSIDVIPGTAAAEAGLQNLDRIIAFDQNPVELTDHLIRLVSEKEVGDPFQLRVRRIVDGEEQEVTLNGRMGAYLMVPVAANEDWVLAHRALVHDHQHSLQVSLDHQPSEVVLISAADGQQRWRRILPQQRRASGSASPLLASHHLLLAQGQDLAAYNLKDHNHSKLAHPSWLLPGSGDALANAALIGQHFLMLSDHGNHVIRLVDIRNGRVLFEIPSRDGASRLILDDGELTIWKPREGSLSIWDLTRGLRRWQQRFEGTELVAVHGDSLYMIDNNRRLVMIDRANGRLRRTISDLAMVEAFSTHHSTTYVHGRDNEGRQFIAAVGLGGGTLRWRRNLPVGAELRDAPRADAHGVHLEIVSRESAASILSLDSDGNLRGVGESGAALIHLPTATLTASENTLRLTPRALPAKAHAIPAISLSENFPLADIEAGTLKRMAWQDAPGARWAIAQRGRYYVVLVRLEAGTESAILRIGNQGPDIDPFGQRLLFSPASAPSLNTSAQGWRMQAFHRLESAEDGVWLGAVLLSPPSLPELSSRPEVLFTTSAAVPLATWWLRRHWHPVKNAQDAP